VGYCYPSGLEKTLCKWDIHICHAGHERVNFLLLLKIIVKEKFLKCIERLMNQVFCDVALFCFGK
jgi:hypothetical protein